MVTQKNAAAVLESQIGCVKYTIFSLNAVLWILGGGMFGLAVWLRVEPGFQEWVEMLDMSDYYTGIYILIVTSIAVMVLAFYGSAAALMEHALLLYINIGLQVLFFILGLAGAAVLLDYSTYDSQIQPIIHRSMTRLIMNSHQPRASQVLDLLKPLPTECRDTVTGNAFFHGCVDELTWFLESRSGWLAGLALALCMLHVVQASLSLILIQAKQKEDEAVIYKR